MMKHLLVCSFAMVCFSGSFAQNTKEKVKTKTDNSKIKTETTIKGPSPVMKTLLDTFSYAAGLTIAQNMKDQGINTLNSDMMKRAIDDVFKKRTPLLSHELANTKLQEQMSKFMESKAAAEMAQAGGEKAKGAAFMNENKKRKEVTTLPNGLQYEVLKAGEANGAKPLSIDTVVVHYTGTLIDGTKFDSSVDRGEPTSFPLNGVIRGWTEILQLMPKGSKWKVTIPSDLAYGDRGAGGSIKPGATLVFDIELLDIKPAGK